MENTVLSIVLGIVSSLIATAFFIAISELTRRLLIPWYTDRIYRGARIDGRWELKRLADKEVLGSRLGMYMDLTQSGDEVSGTYSHKGNDGTVDTYRLAGCIRDRYFLATATPVSNRHLDGVALVLYLRTENSELVLSGGALFCSEPGGVKSQDALTFVWQKQ